MEINRVQLVSQHSFVSPYSVTDFEVPVAGQFANLKKLKFGSISGRYGIIHGFELFQSDAVEELTLSYFNCDIDNFIMRVTPFQNLKVLELEFPMQLIRSMNPYQFNSAVWRPNGIKELILRNSRLTKITVRPHPNETSMGFGAGAIAAKSEYAAMIKENLNDEWEVHCGKAIFVVSKVVKK